MIPQSRLTPALGLLFVVEVGGSMDAQIVRQRDASGREVERRCEPAVWPKKLPPLDAVLDSAALIVALHALSEGDTHSILFSVVYREGRTVTVRVVDPDAPPSPVVASLLEVVVRGLRSLAPPRPLGAVRVRLRGGGHGIATVERSLYCPPEPAPDGPSGTRRVVVAVSPGDRLPTPGRRLRIDAEVSIDETGNVTDVRLITGSGLREIDDSFVSDQRERRFLPAMLDGLPIASWVRTTGPRMRL